MPPNDTHPTVDALPNSPLKQSTVASVIDDVDGAIRPIGLTWVEDPADPAPQPEISGMLYSTADHTDHLLVGFDFNDDVWRVIERYQDVAYEEIATVAEDAYQAWGDEVNAEHIDVDHEAEIDLENMAGETRKATMNGKCDMEVRDCNRDAEYLVTISDETWTLERECCEYHKGWYRMEFEDRGYDVEFEPRAES